MSFVAALTFSQKASYVYHLCYNRWLIAQGNREEAIDILRKTHHITQEDVVMLTVTEIEAQIGMNVDVT
jgi:hypothetical protein